MKIIYINTQNKLVAKDIIVRKAIEAGMQYIEMEDEVLIDCDYLFRIVSKETILDCSFPIIFDVNEKRELFEIVDKADLFNDSLSSVSILKKNDFKRESKRVNVLVKNRQYSNLRRRYK